MTLYSSLSIPMSAEPQKGTSAWWNQERKTELEGKWADGLTSGQIASEMGVSRCAILGKVRRMGLPMRKGLSNQLYPKGETSAFGGAIVRRTRRLGRKVAAAERYVAEVKMELLPPTSVALIDLESHHCRYIVGSSAGDGLALFCGVDKAEGSYCARHARLCYNPYHR